MASPLMFDLGGTTFEAVPVKLEREKLYGHTDVVATDAAGEVYHHTDYSPSRKVLLKRDIRVSSSKEQILALMEADIAENVKKGWIEA